MPVLAVLLWIVSFHHFFHVDGNYSGYLYSFFVKIITPIPHRHIILGCTLLFISQGLHLNYILNRHEVLFINSWIPAVIYTLIAMAFSPFATFHPLLLTQGFVVFLLEKTFRLYKQGETYALNMDAGVIIGIATLIYFPSALLLLFFIAGTIILKPFNWRDPVIVLLGFTTPFFIITSILFLYGKPILKLIPSHTALFDFHFPVLKSVDNTLWITIGLLGFLMLMALFKLSSNFYKNVIRTRNMQQMIFVLLGICILMAIFTPYHSFARYYFISLPLSVIISYYFVATKKIVLPEVLFICLVLCVIFNLTR